MYRVELKDEVISYLVPSLLQFLMYRVELKDGLNKLGNPPPSLFLMYRVELKGRVVNISAVA